MSVWSGRRVLVTGGSGFIGSHLIELLLAAGARVSATASSDASCRRFVYEGHEDVDWRIGDLGDPAFCSYALKDQDLLMHLAASVGGIEYNIAHPASIFRDNLRVYMNCMEAARDSEVEVLVTSSACVYPRHCSIPTKEEEGFLDRPEPTNEGYGWAKRMEEFLAEAYAREYGMKVHVARPYNAYGPRDNFDPLSSHVIPALIRRVFEAKDKLVVWGDGSASRSFLYAMDFARGLMAVAEKSPQVEAINIGAFDETTIGDTARMIVELSGKDLEIEFDASKPSGQPRRKCDTTLCETLLGYKAQVPFREGLKRTIAWYVENQD